MKEKAFRNNSWVDAHSGKTFDVLNPSTGKVIARVPDQNTDDLLDYIKDADWAFNKWRSLTAENRSNFLKKWFRLIEENKEDLAKLITIENGKPLADARAEVSYSAGYVEWFAEEGRRVYGDIIPSGSTSKRYLVLKQPVGVTGMITPWNFPSAMITRKVAAALAVGCTTIIKPSEETPLSALALCQLAQQAGFPDGVINVLTCSKGNAPAVGGAMCNSPIISKISFTGSTYVGKILIKNSAETVKKLSLELGGNAPFIVFNGADLDLAVKGVIAGKFRCSGQTCISPNRLLVQCEIHDEFVEKLKGAVSKLKLGDGMDSACTQGPLINRASVDKVLEHIKDAVSKGAKIVLGGKSPGQKSNFMEPTILTNVNVNCLCCQDETFGPLVPIVRFIEEDDAILIANQCTSGLASYIFSSDISQIWRVSEKLQTGMVGINDAAISAVQVPFGGVKESGYGREGSKYGVDDYLNIKYLCMGELNI
ncbi:hypothetical protein HELRODRAFT_95271 [Helobdella robusta]|uniref:Succinate-semialdehyde dehydrogenase n=1 Tax=Helobdella robusta TaxID=6412 RepID=T1G953_HELRO|nr:hypothetical protein HELRODRAFT_95271 [Helobdella robusta]ESN96189.1 hypothetical protein HELRODRAFT_95271 [Helobdella robusta]